MLTPSDFSHLKFLEGRWEGSGPDGKPFYEQYSFPGEGEMRATRFADETFVEPKDGQRRNAGSRTGDLEMGRLHLAGIGAGTGQSMLCASQRSELDLLGARVGPRGSSHPTLD